MTIAFWTFLHLLAFVYWLGGDLGAFILSRTVTRQDETLENRLFAARALMVIDLAPRISLIVAIPSGLTLASVMGWWPLQLPFIVIVWLVSALWLCLALYLHHGQASLLLRRADIAFRTGVAAGLIIAATILSLPLFISIKLTLLSIAIGLGLWIRHCLKDLAVGLKALAEGDTETANPILKASIGKSRLPVIGIWISISLSALMGILRLQ